jgi:hypothetical protein
MEGIFTMACGVLLMAIQTMETTVVIHQDGNRIKESIIINLHGTLECLVILVGNTFTTVPGIQHGNSSNGVQNGYPSGWQSNQGKYYYQSRWHSRLPSNFNGRYFYNRQWHTAHGSSNNGGQGYNPGNRTKN